MNPFEAILSYTVGLELIYSLVIVTSCFMIYYSTKEMYELSYYRGLGYFRKAFLFFGVAYIFRYMIRALFVIFDLHDVFDLYPHVYGLLSLPLFLYFSSMGIFYLLYSVMWKKWNHEKNRLLLFHISAITIALVGTVFRLIAVHLILNIVLLSIVIFVLLVAFRESKNKQKNNLYVIYLFFSVFWFLSVIDLLIP
jgi:hypothetical protein